MIEQTAEVIRVLPKQDIRVETGPIQFGDDWPGLFVRGDEALGLANEIEALQLDGTSLPAGGAIGAVLNRVVDLLQSCKASKPSN